MVQIIQQWLPANRRSNNPVSYLIHKAGCLSRSPVYTGLLKEWIYSNASEGIDLLVRARVSRQREESFFLSYPLCGPPADSVAQIKGRSHLKKKKFD